MKTRLILLIMAIGIFLTSCADVNEAKQAEKRYTPVKIQILQETFFNDYLTVTGKARAVKEVKIIAEESGILKEIYKDKGSYVQLGDTLAILDNQIVVAQYKQARAAYHKAEINYKSYHTLYKKNAVSEMDYLSAKYNLEAAQAAYDLAKARYEKLFLRATITGLVNERYVDEGAFVTPMSPVFELLDKRYIKVRAGIAERFFDEIHVGAPVEITFDAFPGLIIHSQIAYKSHRIDPLSRTFTIEVEFPNPEGKLSSEIIANLKILKKKYENKIIIPQDVVIETEKGYYVFVEKDSVVHQVPIQVEDIVESKMVVSGLNPGDHLVVVGQRNVADQDTVMIVE